MIGRREVIISIGAAALAWPLVARAQRKPVIGFLAGYLSQSPEGQHRLAMFQRSLADAGFVDGRDVVIEARWAEERYDRLPLLAAELVQRHVDLIVASSTPASLAAKAATSTIPIVFTTSSDPVTVGLVPNLARPGGNCTGVTRMQTELGPKKLQLMHELVPAATSMALLVNPMSPEVAKVEIEKTRSAAGALGLQIHVIEASDEQALANAFVSAAQLRVGGLIISSDAFYLSHYSELGALTLKHRVPTIYSYREFVAAGGLMGYATSAEDSFRVAGQYAARILRGEKPAEMPVQQATKVELRINIATAKVLGITVPPTLLLRADEVIE